MRLWWSVAVVVAVAGPAVGLACGGTFLDAEGTIASPGYPSEYPHNMDCVYNVLASADARIKLSCPDINIQKSDGCLSDSLCINGIHHCGISKLDSLYGQGAITLRFTSDGTLTRKRGFKCTYQRISGRDYVGDALQHPSLRAECVTPPPTTVAPVTTLAPTPAPTTPSSCAVDSAEYDYDEVLQKSLLFYEAQRSGYLPASQRVTWRRDSATGDALDAETNEAVDLEGGYYDAGDYVKFGYPMASALTVLAWGAVEYGEAYKAAGEMANMRAAVKWGTDYFLKAHVAPNEFYGQVGLGDLDHAYWGRPEDMTMARPAYKITETKPGSDLAGETAAALAAASILFKDSNPTYSNTCLQHARELYDFANNFRGKYADSISDAAKFYNSWGTYYDELAWAALWLYRATGEATYLSQAKTHYSSIYIDGVNEFSWAEKTPGAMVLLAQFADASDKPTYAQHLESFCDRIVNEKPRTPKGLVYISQWGSLRYAANVALVCLRAADLGIKSETYREFGKQQIHYMLGSTGRSFVVGFGTNPPQRPHHSSSSCKDPPEPCSWSDYHSSEPNPHVLNGALVGGPDNNDNYVDVRSDYISNEVTCDYNSGFQSAVAALRQLAGCGGSSTGTTNAPTSTAIPVTTDNSGSTAAPVTTAAPGTTSGPEATTEGTANCATVEQTNEWSGNFQANLIVQVPFDTTSWSIALQFSGTVTQFQVWTAEPSATPSSTITLTNKSYNGWQAAGNTLTINFIASYSGTKPEATAITFNGTPLCLN